MAKKRIFLIFVDLDLNLCKASHVRAYEAKPRALAMPYKDSDPSQQKSRKCVFWPFLNRRQKKVILFTFANQAKIL